MRSCTSSAGQTIKKGAIIARISLRPNMLNVSAAEAQVLSARINLRNQTTEFERHKKLLAQKLISESEFNTVRHQLRPAEGSGGVGREHVAVAEDRRHPELGQRLQHDSRHHRRHGAGRANKEGAFILESSTFQSGTTLATLADMNDMIFEGLVDESEVGKLQAGHGADPECRRAGR